MQKPWLILNNYRSPHMKYYVMNYIVTKLHHLIHQIFIRRHVGLWDALVPGLQNGRIQNFQLAHFGLVYSEGTTCHET